MPSRVHVEGACGSSRSSSTGSLPAKSSTAWACHLVHCRWPGREPPTGSTLRATTSERPGRGSTPAPPSASPRSEAVRRGLWITQRGASQCRSSHPRDDPVRIIVRYVADTWILSRTPRLTTLAPPRSRPSPLVEQQDRFGRTIRKLAESRSLRSAFARCRAELLHAGAVCQDASHRQRERPRSTQETCATLTLWPPSTST
jgi:hypothetical protein